jgi:hypothetical protein
MDRFIMCKDEKIANELQGLGCKLLNFNDGIYTLVNNSKSIKFSEEFKNKIVFTNKLNF